MSSGTSRSGCTSRRQRRRRPRAEILRAVQRFAGPAHQRRARRSRGCPANRRDTGGDGQVGQRHLRRRRHGGTLWHLSSPTIATAPPSGGAHQAGVPDRGRSPGRGCALLVPVAHTTPWTPGVRTQPDAGRELRSHDRGGGQFLVEPARGGNDVQRFGGAKRRRPSSRSKPASGEPSYPEMKRGTQSAAAGRGGVRSAIIRRARRCGKVDGAVFAGVPSSSRGGEPGTRAEYGLVRPF